VKPVSLRKAAERFVQGHPGTWLAIAFSMMAVVAFGVVLLIELATWIRETLPSPQNSIGKEQTVGAVQVSSDVSKVLQPMASVVVETSIQAPWDVYGTDPGPVARFPGLARSHWHPDGREITVRYEGDADFDVVLNHYVNGFAAGAYSQRILPPDGLDGVKHEYVREGHKVRFALSKKPKGGIKVSIITGTP
jgi:hypothetical protein